MGDTCRQQITLGKYCTTHLAEAGQTRQTNKLAEIRSFNTMGVPLETPGHTS
jgi:hypothetical protein